MLNSGEPRTGRPRNRFVRSLAAVIGIAVLATGAYMVWVRLAAYNEQLEIMAGRLEEIAESSREASERASRAEQNAAVAAEGRLRAEQAQAEAQRETTAARTEAEAAAVEARSAREEADRIRREREEELNRLQTAFSALVETRRTAMGLVMNLGSDAIEFDFDRAELRAANRELLSRIAGILLTTTNYSIYVYGHTDDVGSEEYNLQLSEQRAAAVREYLVEAGVSPEIISTRGFGKSSPRASGTSAEARAMNRRVEIGLIDVSLDFRGLPIPDTSSR